MALLHYAAKFYPFLSLDCAPTLQSGTIQGGEGIKFCFALTSGHTVGEQVQKHKEVMDRERQVRGDAARATEELEECVCCYSDEVSQTF